MKNTKANRLEERQGKLDHMKSEGWEITHLETPKAVVCRISRNGKHELKIYKGTAAKAMCWYGFKTTERRDTYEKETLDSLQSWQDSKKAKKAGEASEHYTVGDVLYSSWGYDQTNVEYYQITKVKGSYIWFKEVCQNSSDQAGSPHGGYTQPIRNAWLPEDHHRSNREHRKLVQNDGSVKAPISGYLYKWDGRAKYTSSYH